MTGVKAALTGIGFALTAYLGASQYGPTVAMVAAVLAFVVSGAVTDVGFRLLLREGLFQFLVFFRGNWVARFRKERDAYNSTHQKGGAWFAFVNQGYRFATWVVIVGLIGYFTVADLSGVDSAKQSVGKVGIMAPPLFDAAEAGKEIAAAQSVTLQQYRKDIGAIEREIDQTRADVARKHASLAALAGSGNGWAKGQLEAKRSAATANARKRLEKARELYSSKAATLSEAGTAQVATAQKMADDAAKAYAESVAAREWLFVLMAKGSTYGAIACAFIVILLFLADAKDTNGDGVITAADIDAVVEAPQSPVIAPVFHAQPLPQPVVAGGVVAKAVAAKTVVATASTVPQNAIDTVPQRTTTVGFGAIRQREATPPQPSATPRATAPQTPKIVTVKQYYDHPDHALRKAKKALTAERSNIVNKNGRRDTVLNRVAEKIHALTEACSADGVTPELVNEAKAVIYEIENMMSGWSE